MLVTFVVLAKVLSGWEVIGNRLMRTACSPSMPMLRLSMHLRYLGSAASDDGDSAGHFLGQILHELSVPPRCYLGDSCYCLTYRKLRLLQLGSFCSRGPMMHR